MGCKKMKKACFLIILLMTIFVGASTASAQLDITREPLFRVPDDLTTGLLGIRSAEDRVFIANSNGKYLRFDLDTGESFSGKTGSEKISDFDVVLGQLIFIDENGKLGGHVLPVWPDTPWDSCRIEACDQGLLLFGGDKSFFLARNASTATEIDNVNFVLPVPNGFFWSMEIRPAGNWGADLYDCLGNKMSEIYNFAPDFKPAGVEVGPAGPEGELVVSAFEDGVRRIAFIGNNGRMFWKIDGPEKLSKRDLAFDKQGDLLVLEKNGKELWLNRWKMAFPEG